MSEFFAANLVWVLLYPFWAFILIGIGRFLGVRMSKPLLTGITLFGSGLGLVFSLGALVNVFINGASEYLCSFIKIQKFLLQLGVGVDLLSMICLSLLFFISFFIQLYSSSYMGSEPKYYRYFGYMNLFNFSMALLLVSPNLFQIYIGWELVGVVSYLLIGFKYSNPIKSISAVKAFIINKIGDTMLLGGVVSLIYIMYAYSTSQFVTLDFSDFNLISSVAYAHTNNFTFIVLCMLLFAGVMTKSAQFPFHTWLQDAMSAPTPVSALIHSATMVAAGVFLTIRLLPLFTMSKDMLIFIVMLGMFTALFCSLCAICQKNIKSVLAYSTSANLGLMLAAVGFGNVNLAVLFLIVHGLIKAALFLSYGLSNNEYFKNNTEEQTISPSFIIGAFALSGLAFAGLNCKEQFFLTFKPNIFLTIEFLLVSFMCAVYIFRLCCLYPLSSNKRKNVPEQLSVWIFLTVVIVSTFMVNGSILGAPFWIAFVGAIVAIVLTLRTKYTKSGCVSIVCEKGFYIDRFYSRVVFNLYERFTSIFSRIDIWISDNKLLFYIARYFVRCAEWVEKNIFELPVKLIVLCLRFASKEVEHAQIRNIQTYITYGALILGIIFSAILLMYSFIINSLGGIG